MESREERPLRLGIVLVRERIANPWQEFVWTAVEAVPDAPVIDAWRVLSDDGSVLRVHAATFPLELHRKETPSYKANLESDEPSIYVVLRNEPAEGSAWPVHVHLATPSPYEAQAYGEAEGEVIHRVPMPAEVVDLLAAYVAAHHKEEPFRKRQRGRGEKDEQHLFGQEPIHILRARQRTRGEG